jgi:hypothetical protein
LQARMEALEFELAEARETLKRERAANAVEIER